MYPDFDQFTFFILFCVDRHLYYLVCQKSFVFFHHSSDAVLYLCVFQAPSPAENGLSGLLVGKFLQSSNDSESF